MASDWRRHPASFRDPSGFIVESSGRLLRAIHPGSLRDLDALVESGLYSELTQLGLLVAHEDLGIGSLDGLPGWHVVAPQRLPLISYPCEWTFAQLKAAGLLTLDIQCRALARGLSLKDASAFNIQFVGGRPVMMDTLSFSVSPGDGPWVAYRQFCEHFLGPLALRSYRVAAAWLLSQAQIEGVALSTVSSLLPARTWLKPGLLTHIHLHSRAGSNSTGASGPLGTGRIPARRVPGFAMQLAHSLQAATQAIVSDLGMSAWSDYRQTSTYAKADVQAKTAFVLHALSAVKPQRALDLGANDGLYSVLLAEHGVPCTAVEFDATCAEDIYSRSLQVGPATLNTMRIDLANPTPAHGWAGEERASFAQRVRCDLVLALALIHHLSISRQVPYALIAQFFAELGTHLVVEFVPPNDPMSMRLLAARTGVVDPVADYGEVSFLQAFEERFEVLQRSSPLAGGRLLFLMRRRGAPS